ncbi:barstar family protein [Saccharopolyspora sp. NPDC050642]|uniref:barstar family protein n=1 Tax=Saccharopolyspora sp. NPDC050642 TaxID=3157099 RepID=UPI00340A7EF5
MINDLNWDAILAPGVQAPPGRGRSAMHWAHFVTLPNVQFTAALERLSHQPPADGAHLAVIDGSKCQSDRELFDEFARQLEFPSYFGYNWGAFDECLSDLLVLDDGGLGAAFGDRAGVAASTLLIAIKCTKAVLVRENRHEFGKFISALQAAANGELFKYVRPRPRVARLRVVLHSDDQEFGHFNEMVAE